MSAKREEVKFYNRKGFCKTFKVSVDEQEILGLINSYYPARTKYKSGLGFYVKIGSINVISKTFYQISKDNSIEFACHYTQGGSPRFKTYDEREVKSRFGERNVAFKGGRVWSCDNDEAKEHYQKLADASIVEISDLIQDGDLKSAIDKKKELKKEGKYG